jgi:hypothetical protein
MMVRDRKLMRRGKIMMSASTEQSQAAGGAASYSATVICGRYTDIKLTNLVAALRTVAPSSVIGDWAGPFKSPPTDALGTGMLSIDGVGLTLLNVDKPLPPPFFDTGPVPSQLMPNPLQQLRNHRAHVSVMPAQIPQDGPSAVATARAVTQLAMAVAAVTGAEAVRWTDSNNFVPASVLMRAAPMLAPAGSAASAIWIRIMVGRSHDDPRKLIAGSHGLWIFGLREIEYAPIDMSVQELVPHAWSVCDQIFRSNNNVKPGDTIDVDRKSVFKVGAIERGFFGVGPALQLSWLADSKSFDPNRATQ